MFYHNNLTTNMNKHLAKCSSKIRADEDSVRKGCSIKSREEINNFHNK